LLFKPNFQYALDEFIVKTTKENSLLQFLKKIILNLPNIEQRDSKSQKLAEIHKRWIGKRLSINLLHDIDEANEAIFSSLFLNQAFLKD